MGRLYPTLPHCGWDGLGQATAKQAQNHCQAAWKLDFPRVGLSTPTKGICSSQGQQGWPRGDPHDRPLWPAQVGATGRPTQRWPPNCPRRGSTCIQGSGSSPLPPLHLPPTAPTPAALRREAGRGPRGRKEGAHYQPLGVTRKSGASRGKEPNQLCGGREETATWPGHLQPGPSGSRGRPGSRQRGEKGLG